ncbi:hypothetical protein EOD42_14425 [Rhodovarius crocodyli]|uniref:Uncharacterized protein n=1 Tax=Rhodovarius crocodyli TaxID=1979269 RepID=A0A437MF95_9PROT|nr:hypothetical protein [Rhodovarius crocodyli]RVT96303.1 hypothetical protein EOD42_14425 [Rhodovarius crocodyli]
MPRDAPLQRAMLVDEADIEESLAYLRDTAVEFGALKSRKLVLELKLKRARAARVAASQASSTDRREAEGWSSSKVDEIIEESAQAEARFTEIGAMRQYHELRIEVWRSLNANNRRGNI